MEEVFISGIEGTGKHALLPDKDTHLVCSVEEGIGRVHAAAPNAQHVHVRRHRFRHQFPQQLRCGPRVEDVRRDIVCACASPPPFNINAEARPGLSNTMQTEMQPARNKNRASSLKERNVAQNGKR